MFGWEPHSPFLACRTWYSFLPCFPNSFPGPISCFRIDFGYLDMSESEAKPKKIQKMVQYVLCMYPRSPKAQLFPLVVPKTLYMDHLKRPFCVWSLTCMSLLWTLAVFCFSPDLSVFQLKVNCCFGSPWFRIPGVPLWKRIVTYRVPRFESQNHRAPTMSW